jgi:hypothetical protein
MPVHGRKASEHTNAMPLWRACKLQTYFTAKGLIDYFVAEDPSPPTTGGAPSRLGPVTASTSLEEGKLFGDLKADMIQASRDLDKEAEIVQDVEESRADRVPWLVHTGFPTHLRGLRDAEIMSSYALPPSGDDDDDDGEEEGGSSTQRLRRPFTLVRRNRPIFHSLDREPRASMTNNSSLNVTAFYLPRDHKYRKFSH